MHPTSFDNTKKCPCHSHKTYGACCGMFHQGVRASTPLTLMRSRYCAYSLKLADYLIDTTHPDNPHFQSDRNLWKDQILLFCNQTVFQNLEIKSCEETSEEGFVTFRATLKQGPNDSSFTEKSRFRKLDNRWLYLDGIIS